MYEVSLAFARPASIGARGDPRRQPRFGIAGKRLWATLDALLGSPRRRPSQPSNGPLLEIVRALPLEGDDVLAGQPARGGVALAPASTQERTGERADAEHAARLYRRYALAMASCLWSDHWSGELTAGKGSIEAARRYFHRV
jgi:hypothetical protein